LEGKTIALFDLNLEKLSLLVSEKIIGREINPFPESGRDLSIVLDRGISYAQIERAILSLDLPELHRLELADVFESPTLGANKKSLTLRLSFSRPDRTITDAETVKTVEAILAALKKNCSAELRQ
jgi:phenylalanyl-tRNA synthetase beta chain